VSDAAQRDEARQVVQELLAHPEPLDGDTAEEVQDRLIGNLLFLEQEDLQWVRHQLTNASIPLDNRRSVARFLVTEAGHRLAAEVGKSRGDAESR
jgi:hypothetical protein